MAELKKFIEDVAGEKAPIVKHLYEKIVSINSNFVNKIKWKQLTFTIDEDFNHWIVAISVTKKAVNLVFHYGGLLDDPDQKLLVGSSKFLRKLEFKTVDEINTNTISFFITQAIDKREYFIANWRQLNKAD